MTATYATLDDLRARYPYRQITGASTPTDVQVQKWLDAAQARLDGALRTGGLPAPYTDTDAVLILGEWILDAAIGRIRTSYAEANGELTDATGAEDPLLVRFQARLDRIVIDPSIVGAMLGGGADPASTPSLRSYFSSASDADAGGFEPIFQRDRGPIGEGNF